jgi:hypothetical protein
VQQKKFEKAQTLLMHLSELQSFEAGKKKTIMRHVPAASVQVKFRNKKYQNWLVPVVKLQVKQGKK